MMLQIIERGHHGREDPEEEPGDLLHGREGEIVFLVNETRGQVPGAKARRDHHEFTPERGKEDRPQDRAEREDVPHPLDGPVFIPGILLAHGTGARRKFSRSIR